MELTGKAKEALQAYFKGSDDFHNTSVEEFQNYPESMQYGVLVDFFDSVGIDILIRAKDEYGNFQFLVFDFHESLANGVWEESRQHARTAAIKKAVEIFNNRQ